MKKINKFKFTAHQHSLHQETQNEKFSTHYSKISQLLTRGSKTRTDNSQDFPHCNQRNSTFQLSYLSTYKGEEFQSQRWNIKQLMKEDGKLIEVILKGFIYIQQNKKHRAEVLHNIHNTLLATIQQLNNIELKIKIYLILAKLASSYRLTQETIIWAKIAKRLSDNEELIPFKMKAYKLLGESFLNMRKPTQSVIYITKYLLCSWKVGSLNDELKSYELLGKHYFYQGDIDQANLFHTRHMMGHYLKKGSHLKQLGISRLMQGSVGKSKSKNTYNNDYENYNITSDDEPFSVIFGNEDDNDLEQAKEAIGKQIVSLKKPSLLNHQIRLRPSFDRKILKQVEIEYRKANQSIRQVKQTSYSKLTGQDGHIDFRNLQGHTRSIANLGNLRCFIHVNHLSPNRVIENYQFQGLKVSEIQSPRFEQITPLYRKSDLKSIAEQLKKIIDILQQTLRWIEEQK